jgi:secreted trypsin-like serine protease
VKVNGISDYYICSDNWDKKWSDMACQQMGFGISSTSVDSLQVADGSLFAQIDPTQQSTSKNVLTYLKKTTSCPSNRVINGLSCNPLGCGTRMVSMNSTGPYVVNGDAAARGAWPWQVSIVYDGRLLCGGSILNNQWILTVTHCSLSYKNLNLISVRAGSVLFYGSDPDAQNLKVDRVITHPDYNDNDARNVIINDIALLRLSKPVTFTDTVRPICLPSENVNLQQFKVCVATGFGHTRSESSIVSPYLQQGKMQPMTTDECFSSYRQLAGSTWDASRSDFAYILCAGSTPAGKGVDVCQGDSGGPLACRDQNNVWTVVGVTSFVFVECQLSVFTRVSMYEQWIRNTIS